MNALESRFPSFNLFCNALFYAPAKLQSHTKCNRNISILFCFNMPFSFEGRCWLSLSGLGLDVGKRPRENPLKDSLHKRSDRVLNGILNNIIERPNHLFVQRNLHDGLVNLNRFDFDHGILYTRILAE